MADYLETAALSALDELLCATDHYGFKDERTEEFWENYAVSAMEDGKTSDDIRREVWERARKALLAVNQRGANLV